MWGAKSIWLRSVLSLAKLWYDLSQHEENNAFDWSGRGPLSLNNMTVHAANSCRIKTRKKTRLKMRTETARELLHHLQSFTFLSLPACMQSAILRSERRNSFFSRLKFPAWFGENIRDAPRFHASKKDHFSWWFAPRQNEDKQLRKFRIFFLLPLDDYLTWNEVGIRK